MSCPDCGAATVAFAVPDDCREYAPDESAAAAICSRRLTVAPADAPDSEPDFSAVSEGFPSGDAAVGLALALGRLESLATNRAAIEALLDRVERAGVDPLLAIDRLLSDSGIDPAIDLARRRHQLEQLLY